MRSPTIRASEMLDVIFGGLNGYVEARALPGQQRCFAPVGDWPTLATFARQQADQNLYYGVALRRGTTGGTLADCTLLPAIYADLDFKTVPEADARARLAGCPLPPSIIVATGGGLHPYWLQKEPADLHSELEPVERTLRGLAQYLGADRACAEAARVLRVPGTRNFKYTPPLLVTVETFEPDRRYTLSDFEPWLPTVASTGTGARDPLHVEGDISEGQRNASLFRLGRSLRAKGVPDATILVSLHAVNEQQCQPPLPAREVDAIGRSVLDQADRSDFHPPASGDTPFALTTVGDLLAEPEEDVDWLVDGVLTAGGVALMAAKPKVGKSTAARGLALAVARGETWIGHPCASGMVWYLAFEGRRRDVRGHFRQMGARPDDALRVFVGQAPRNVVAQVRRLAEQERPVLIIIDTMQRFLRASSTDDYAEMTTLLDAVIGIAQQSGATVLLLHHSGKADRASLDAVLGSTAITGSADTIILLARTERYRTISTVQRVGDDLDDTLLLLDETGRVTLGPSRQTADEGFVGDAILSALHHADGPLTEAQIEELVDARTGLKRRALRQLVAREQANRTGRGGKGDPYRYTISCSRSLVPYNKREQENKHDDSVVTPRETAPDACSHVRAQGSCSLEPHNHPDLPWRDPEEQEVQASDPLEAQTPTPREGGPRGRHY